jgi:hypothetical protein
LDVERCSTSEDAQQRLVLEYPELNANAVVEVMDLLEDPIKARSFLILPKGHIRDVWILKRLPEDLREAAAASMIRSDEHRADMVENSVESPLA